MEKIALIATGGGMQCAYSAGCFTALAEKFNLPPVLIIAASGSAGNAYYYCSGQTSNLKRIWTEHLATPNFISWSRINKQMDIDYLIDVVLSKLEPFSEASFSETKSIVYTPLLNSKGSVSFISNKDKVKPLEVLRAAKALPFLYGQKVKLGDDYYSDGAAHTSLEDMMVKAGSLGATRFIIIDNKINNRIYKFIKRLLFRAPNTKYPAVNKNNIIATIKLTSGSFNLATKNPKLLLEMYNRGYADTESNQGLQEYFKLAK